MEMGTLETPVLDKLVLAVVKASEHCPQEVVDSLLTACDDLEEEYDFLQAGTEKLQRIFQATQEVALNVTKERDALQTQLEKQEFQYRALCTDRRMEKLDAEEKRDALKAERDALKAERDALKAELEAVQVAVGVGVGQLFDLMTDLSRFKPSWTLTVADQITRWAEANYSKSHEAQAVVEGCYDTEELEEFGSLEAFKKHAGIRDDYREDIIAAGGA